MRRMIVVLGAAVVMAATVTLTAGAALAQAEVEKYQEEAVHTFTDYNACTGEEILWQGLWRGNIHVTTNDGGRHVAGAFHYIHLTGTGVETGDACRATGASTLREHQLLERESELSRYFYEETGMGLTISRGDSPNYLARYQARVRPSGYFEVLSRDCTAGVEPQWPEESTK